MGMIGHKYPRIADGLRFRNQYGQPLQKIFTIKIVSKNPPAFNPANNNMMQYTGGIRRLWGIPTRELNASRLFAWIDYTKSWISTMNLEA
jgi:hypothetical protein